MVSFAAYGIFKMFHLPWEGIETTFVIFFPLFIWGLHYLMMTIKDKLEGLFLMAIMGVIGLKMIVSLTIFVLYIKFNPENKITVGIFFVCLYFIYTIFEIRALLKMNKAIEEKKS